MIRRALPALRALAGTLLAAPATPARAAAADPTRTPATPAYTISLTSNATGGTWTGHESVTFSNPSADPLTEVYLRLWDNAHGRCPSPPITVTNVTGGTASALTVGCTAMKITLPAALPKGGT